MMSDHRNKAKLDRKIEDVRDILEKKMDLLRKINKKEQSILHVQKTCLEQNKNLQVCVEIEPKNETVTQKIRKVSFQVKNDGGEGGSSNVKRKVRSSRSHTSSKFVLQGTAPAQESNADSKTSRSPRRKQSAFENSKKPLFGTVSEEWDAGSVESSTSENTDPLLLSDSEEPGVIPDSQSERTPPSILEIEAQTKSESTSHTVTRPSQRKGRAGKKRKPVPKKESQNTQDSNLDNTPRVNQDGESQGSNKTNSQKVPLKRKRSSLENSLDYSFLDDDQCDMYSQIKSRRRRSSSQACTPYSSQCTPRNRISTQQNTSPEPEKNPHGVNSAQSQGAGDNSEMASVSSVDDSQVETSEVVAAGDGKLLSHRPQMTQSSQATEGAGIKDVESVQASQNARQKNRTKKRKSAAKGKETDCAELVDCNQDSSAIDAQITWPKSRASPIVTHFSLPDSQYAQLKQNKSCDEEIRASFMENTSPAGTSAAAGKGRRRGKKFKLYSSEMLMPEEFVENAHVDVSQETGQIEEADSHVESQELNYERSERFENSQAQPQSKSRKTQGQKGRRKKTEVEKTCEASAMDFEETSKPDGEALKSNDRKSKLVTRKKVPEEEHRQEALASETGKVLKEFNKVSHEREMLQEAAEAREEEEGANSYDWLENCGTQDTVPSQDVDILQDTEEQFYRGNYRRGRKAARGRGRGTSRKNRSTVVQAAEDGTTGVVLEFSAAEDIVKSSQSGRKVRTRTKKSSLGSGQLDNSAANNSQSQHSETDKSSHVRRSSRRSRQPKKQELDTDCSSAADTGTNPEDLTSPNGENHKGTEAFSTDCSQGKVVSDRGSSSRDIATHTPMAVLHMSNIGGDIDFDEAVTGESLPVSGQELSLYVGSQGKRRKSESRKKERSQGEISNNQEKLDPSTEDVAAVVSQTQDNDLETSIYSIYTLRGLGPGATQVMDTQRESQFDVEFSNVADITQHRCIADKKISQRRNTDLALDVRKVHSEVLSERTRVVDDVEETGFREDEQQVLEWECEGEDMVLPETDAEEDLDENINKTTLQTVKEVKEETLHDVDENHETDMSKSGAGNALHQGPEDWFATAQLNTAAKEEDMNEEVPYSEEMFSQTLNQNEDLTEEYQTVGDDAQCDLQILSVVGNYHENDSGDSRSSSAQQQGDPENESGVFKKPAAYLEIQAEFDPDANLQDPDTADFCVGDAVSERVVSSVPDIAFSGEEPDNECLEIPQNDFDSSSQCIFRPIKMQESPTVTPLPENRASLTEYEIAEADSDDEENEDVSDDDIEKSRSSPGIQSDSFGRGTAIQGCLKFQQRVEVGSALGKTERIRCVVAGSSITHSQTAEYLIVCTEQEIQLRSAGSGFELLHIWNVVQGGKIHAAHILTCKDKVAFLTVMSTVTNWQCDVHVFEQDQATTFTMFKTSRAQHRRPIACVISDREVCVAHPCATAKEFSQVARCTEVTKYMLSRDLSTCLSDLSLTEVSDTLTSLLGLESNKAALLGTSQNTLYIWNHDNRNLLKQIKLTTALTLQTNLQHAALIRACHSVRECKGRLYLTVTKTHNGCDQVSLLVVNPSNSQCTTLPAMCLPTREDPAAREIREVHQHGELICGFTDRSLVLWSLTNIQPVGRKPTTVDTTAHVTRQGRFYLASAGVVSVYKINTLKDE